MRELGIAIDMGPWLGFLAPTGVPNDVLTRLHDAIEASLAEPQVAETMKKMTMVIERMDQRAYQTFYNNEYDRWGEYIRTAKVKLDQ
jgi:tripartite-type tricarboxylate transporter receptor subunit TctC